ncbi:MAG: hypothetical protein E7354_00740 [Clostridiales bacterium]|nr:hypothetical protein [Clostridiales bacterium]
MKALKGLMIYIGIVFGIIFAIAVLLFGIMYFAPNFRLFGVGVTHANEEIKGEPIEFSDYTGYDSIELSLSSNKVPVIVTASSEVTDIEYKLVLATFGISFDITEYRVSKVVEVKDSVLKVALSVTEPNGWISMGGSKVAVTVPANKTYALVLNTKSADISLGSTTSNELKISKLTATTGSGNLKYIKNEEDENDRNVTLSSLNLTTGSGEMNFSQVATLSVTAPIKLSADRGSFVFNDIVGSLDIRGTGVSFVAENVSCDSNGFTFMSENGKFKVNNLSSPNGAENTIITDTCSVEVVTLSGKTGIITTSGSINIEEAKDDTILQSEHGAIHVNKALKDINILTHYGNITVDSYLRNATFTSKRGNIVVNSTGEYEQGLVTHIENVDGNIEVINKVNKLRIKTLGSSKVTVTFEEVKNSLTAATTFEHSVQLHDKGSAVVYLPAIISEPFKFKATGNISGSISGLGNEDYMGNTVVADEDYQYYPNNSQTNIDKSSLSCYFLFHGTIEFKSYTR